MTTRTTYNDHKEPDAVWFCKRLARQLAAGICSFEECVYSLTCNIVHPPADCIEQCVAVIPAHVRADYLRYLRENVVSVDFMPDPLPFIAGIATEERIEAKKRELRPNYLRLYDLVSDAQQKGTA